MIRLYIFPPAFGLRNVSPFCVKLEMLLKHLDLPHEVVQQADPRPAPKQKLPYIEVDGKQMGDSELITEYLDEMTQGGVYKNLTPQQRAQGVALTRLAEDHLYWLMVASRWLDDDWFPNVVNGFFGFIPGLIRGFAAGGARRNMAKTFELHGLGKHSLEEQRGFARRDLQALNDAVPEAGFLFGDEPCIYDFTVAGLMSGLLDHQPGTWLNELTPGFQRLIDYTERVQAEVGVYARENV